MLCGSFYSINALINKSGRKVGKHYFLYNLFTSIKTDF